MYLAGIVAAIGVACAAEADAAARPDAAVCDGTAQLQVALAAERGRACWRQRLVVPATAGTLIFAVAVVVWAAAYFPRDPQVEQRRPQPLRRSAPAARREPRRRRAAEPPADNGAGGRNSEDGSGTGRTGTADGERSRGGLHATQLPGTGRPADRAGRQTAGLGLADRLRGDRLVPGPRSGDRHAGRHLPVGRRPGCGVAVAARDAAGGDLARDRAAACSTCRWPCRSWCSSLCAPSALPRWP